MHTNLADALLFVLSALAFLMLVFFIGKHLHKAAFPTVFYALLMYIGFNIAMWRIFNALPTVYYFFLLLSTAVLIAVVFFFRRPPKPKNNLGNSIISPAYGKIVQIVADVSHELLSQKTTLVSIFMSPLNIHANFIPAKGEIKSVEHMPGAYLMAFHPKSSEINEHTKVVVKTSFGDILIKQIAGFIARRIITYVEPNIKVEQGDEIGFIKFGSRVDIYIPQHLKLSITIGQVVKGGQTILATVTE